MCLNMMSQDLVLLVKNRILVAIDIKIVGNLVAIAKVFETSIKKVASFIGYLKTVATSEAEVIR